MKNILVPTDFSEASLVALKIAVTISKKDRDASIRLTHAYHVPVVPSLPSDDYGYDVRKQKEMIDEFREKFKQIGKQDFVKGVKVETQLEPHLHVHELLNHKDNANADLIICGIHGNKEWKSLIEGSHTEAIIKAANCPVMIVNEQMKDVDGFHNVVFASDFSDEAVEKFAQLKKVFTQFRAKVHLLKVITKENFMDSLSAEKQMKEFAKKTYLTNFIVKVVTDETVELGIHRYANAVKADLICLETHGYSGFMRYLKGSIAQSVALHSDLPVMTIKMSAGK